MRAEKYPDQLVSLTTGIVSLAGLFICGGIGLLVGSSIEKAVPASLLCGLVGLVGGAVGGFFISARDQAPANDHHPPLKQSDR